MNKDFIPLIVWDLYDNTFFKEGYVSEEFLKHIPFEIKSFFTQFYYTIISSSMEEIVSTLIKNGLINETVFVYIYSENRSFIKETIRKIRKESHIGLVPIFVKNLTEDVEDELIDGYYKNFSTEMVDKAFQIWNILLSLSPSPYVHGTDEYKKVFLLRYLISRNKETLEPKLDKFSRYAFSWKLAYLIIEPENIGDEYEELEILKNQNVFDTYPVDKSSLCPFCKHYNLIIKEVCPNCGSIRIELKDFIHHYTCGYIASVDEFTQGNKLICPKCNDELKHIGVDYDKTLEQYLCLDCKNSFIEPDIKIHCVNCDSKLSPEEITTIFINKYMLSTYGKTLAIEGKLPLSITEEIESILGVISPEVFEYILEKFININKRFPDRSFCLLGILIDMSEKFYTIKPLKAKKILETILTIIKDNIRDTDIITLEGDNYIYILLSETNEAGSIVVKNRISSLVNNVLQKNNAYDLINFKVASVCMPDDKVFSSPEEILEFLEEKLREK